MDQAQVVVHSTRMAVQVLLRLRLLPCSVRARARVRMLCISLVIDARNWVHDFGTQIVDKINQTNHRSSSAISFIALTHTSSSSSSSWHTLALHAMCVVLRTLAASDTNATFVSTTICARTAHRVELRPTNIAIHIRCNRFHRQVGEALCSSSSSSS
jgi:hypothetical protein